MWGTTNRLFSILMDTAAHVPTLIHKHTSSNRNTHLCINACTWYPCSCTYIHAHSNMHTLQSYAYLHIHSYTGSYAYTKSTHIPSGYVTNIHIHMHVDMERERAKPVLLLCNVVEITSQSSCVHIIGDAPCSVFRTHSSFLYLEEHLEQDQGLYNTTKCTTKWDIMEVPIKRSTSYSTSKTTRIADISPSIGSLPTAYLWPPDTLREHIRCQSQD